MVELTQEILEKELVFLCQIKFYMPYNVATKIKLYLRYNSTTDDKIISLIYDTDKNRNFVEYGLKENDLLMSLDDFQELKLIPLIGKLADYLGYATWD